MIILDDKMNEEILDTDGMISRIAKAEKMNKKSNLEVPFDELIQVLQRLQDKNLPEEYEEAITNMSNHVCIFLEGNKIFPKRIDVIDAIKKRFSYSNYKKILKSVVLELSKTQKNWKVIKQKHGHV